MIETDDACLCCGSRRSAKHACEFRHKFRTGFDFEHRASSGGNGRQHLLQQWHAFTFVSLTLPGTHINFPRFLQREAGNLPRGAVKPFRRRIVEDDDFTVA